MRYVFKSGISWSDELIRYAIIWAVFVGAGVCVRKGGNVSVDLVLTYSRGNFKRFLITLINFLGLCFSITMVVIGFKTTMSVMNSGQLSPALQIPMYLLYLSVPVGFVLTAAHFAENLLTFNFESGSTM